LAEPPIEAGHATPHQKIFMVSRFGDSVGIFTGRSEEEMAR
jgi:hypothetical protein